MSRDKIKETQEAVAEWKRLGIARGNMEFSCGGDSMNDYHFEFFDKDNNVVESEVLDSYFDMEIFDAVEFYVNSDGHYMGESGNVEIELNYGEELGEGEEDVFNYSKSAESEWNETFDELASFKVEAKFIPILSKIHSIVGGEDGDGINYKEDCILTDEEEALVDELSTAINDFADEFEFEDAEGEQNGWWRYTTDMSEVETDEVSNVSGQLIDTEGNLRVMIEKTYCVYKID